MKLRTGILKHFNKNQQGDTLIEVVIAIVILGTILFSAYALSNRAFQLGQSAKERSQATQLLQQQAEAVRSLRDNLAWDVFVDRISDAFNNEDVDCSPEAFSGLSGVFHMEKSSGKWQPVNGSFSPGAPALDPGGDIADFYVVEIEGCLVGAQDGATANNVDRFTGLIKISWPRIGSDQTEVSDLRINLTERSF